MCTFWSGTGMKKRRVGIRAGKRQRFATRDSCHFFRNQRPRHFVLRDPQVFSVRVPALQVSAHKIILASASDVFEAMFRYDEQNAKTKTHQLVGIESKTTKTNQKSKIPRKTAKTSQTDKENQLKRPKNEQNGKKISTKTAKTARASYYCIAAPIVSPDIAVEAINKLNILAPSAAGVSDESAVVIPDVTIDAFKTMLHFIYTDDLDRLNGDNLFDVLYAAKKYQITLLVEACLSFPVWNVANIFDGFLQARFLGEEYMAYRCLNHIDISKEKHLEEFLQLDQELLCKILDVLRQRPSGEIAIWNATLRWADEQCRQNGKECSGGNQREMLGPALYKIRLPLISLDAFSNIIVPSGVLTKDEIIGIYLAHSQFNASSAAVQLFPLHFPTEHRMAVPSSSDCTTMEKHMGKVTMKIKKFSEFVREEKECFSDAVNIRHFLWKIISRPETIDSKKFLGFYLQCEGTANKEFDWSCTCSVKLTIVAQSANECGTFQFKDHNFNAEEDSWGWEDFMPFEELMHPDNGWYNQTEDSVELAAEVTPYAPAYPWK